MADGDVTTGSGGGEWGEAPPTAGVRPAAGTRFGRYTILEPLGAGGMGTVYRAQDERLERTVALKIISPGLVNGEAARRRFRTEALALAKLSHPAIAAVYDGGEQDGVDYLVMECVEGETLSAKLAGGPLGFVEATRIVLQIAQALEEAHEQGVVHRDLKPANVMLTRRGQVKVLDFGIAKLLAGSGGVTEEGTATVEAGVVGTPLYMSPEQARGEPVDRRSDLWSLGVLYFQCLTGVAPFRGSNAMVVLYGVIHDATPTMGTLRAGVPEGAKAMVGRALEKEPGRRYQTAEEFGAAAAGLLESLTGTGRKPRRPVWLYVGLTAAVVLLAAAAVGGWLYQRAGRQQWAREEAGPRFEQLRTERKGLAAMAVVQEARAVLPEDGKWKAAEAESTTRVEVDSEPAGAAVSIQDYVAPEGPWKDLGTTPLRGVRIPEGYFRWKVSKAGVGEMVTAPVTTEAMRFDLAAAKEAPAGMVGVPGGQWQSLIGFVGWLGPYQLAPYFIDRYEVTNKEYQGFVDRGGYSREEYWREPFTEDGKVLSWTEALERFRDATGRMGPSTWTGGHYAEGTGEMPVAGVSWYEASAYAVWAGKALPVLAQWYRASPGDLAWYVAPMSNIAGHGPASVGRYQGVGPYGTYDMTGNVREWVINGAEHDRRFLLGGSWRSPEYLAFDPETLSGFDRSDQNGFRCVVNKGPVPVEAGMAVTRRVRDFKHYKPAPDAVFEAYQTLYRYDQRLPLNVEDGGVVQETADWREVKVTIDTAYRGERMAVYLFLPKKVKPPYESVLFFPSARVTFLSDNKNGLALGDQKFFDYVVQSGRAVAFPVYENLYERRVKFSLPSGSQNIQLTTDWYKDAARTLDYLGTRGDIDSSRLAYLGVSMGAAEGIIAAELLQARLKTAIFLDGGFFQDGAPAGGDEADFAPRLKLPVLMVNGRYDYVFSLENAQQPLFDMLGTGAKDKVHVVLDTPHDVTEARPQLVHAVLGWLDRYLGRVE